ncbi:hypothetical protein Rsub_04252 [Raphidocelis subcapitata]|uniref:Glycine zipper domain-containing protein n=1 Tax=Raphidocelis subcapitata TaxID=307507 RepID=A0A2V0NXV6_9CHLO|nr:hypothetical protein Rsub_04252 [Raphidocelis subcapitata]|eukprot:GBF91512.1 hypothetical protein Rsub_04252 [Raphidocelis subcapitata]
MSAPRGGARGAADPITTGLPKLDPSAVAQSQAAHLQSGVVTGAASGALVGGIAGALGGLAGALTGAVTGAASGAAAGAIVAAERGPAGDTVDMGKFGDAAVGGGEGREAELKIGGGREV